MNSPLTLKHALIIVLLGAVVAALPCGYAWTRLSAQARATEYELNSIRSHLESMSACRVTQTEAEANKARISELERNIEAWEGIADACKQALSEDVPIEQ